MPWDRRRQSPAERIVLAAEVKGRAEAILDQMQYSLQELRALLLQPEPDRDGPKPSQP